MYEPLICIADIVARNKDEFTRALNKIIDLTNSITLIQSFRNRDRHSVCLLLNSFLCEEECRHQKTKGKHEE